MTIRARIFQHVSFEGPGSIQVWLEQNNAHIGVTRFFADDPLPDLSTLDLLIVMGGPMSVNDEATLSWLAAEKAFIRAAIAADKALVGICLGAQLIASALDAPVYQGLQKEIGWFDIVSRPERAGEEHLFRLPDVTRVFHWHGETFSLPDGATRLAGSSGYASQVFQIGRQILGFQCHLETTPATAAAIVTHCRDELEAAQGGQYVQSAERMLSEPADTYIHMNRVMSAALDFVTRNA